MVEPFLDTDLTFPHDGAVFDPGGLNVGEIQRMEEVPIGAVARVTHQVHLGEAGLGDVPVIGLDQNVVLQQRAGFGAPIPPSADRALGGRQQAIDLARADGAHLRFGGGRHREAAAGPRQPRRQQGLQAAGPRSARAATQTARTTAAS